MSEPMKIFTGNEYTFTLYESDVRPGVMVRHKQAPLDHGQWIGIDDLVAFMAWRSRVPTRDDRAEAVRRTYTRVPQSEIVHWVETGELDVRKVQDRQLIALSEAIAAERATKAGV